MTQIIVISLLTISVICFIIAIIAHYKTKKYELDLHMSMIGQIQDFQASMMKEFEWIEVEIDKLKENETKILSEINSLYNEQFTCEEHDELQ